MSNIIKLNNLAAAPRVGLNLAATYWSPEQPGETKRLYFIDIKILTNVNENTGETKELNTLVMVDPETREIIHQSSARLVGIFQRENPIPYQPFEIVYKGKVKNSTNAYMSDAWEVYKLDVPKIDK